MKPKKEYEKEILKVIQKNNLTVLDDIFAYYSGIGKTQFHGLKLNKSKIILKVIYDNKKKKNKLLRIENKIKKQDKSNGYIYIIHAEKTNYYKIGISKDAPRNRIASIQTGSVFDLKFIDIRYTKQFRVLEKDLHRQYKDYNVRGEWFELVEKQINEIVNYIITKEMKQLMFQFHKQ